MAQVQPNRLGESVLRDLDEPALRYCVRTDRGCWYDADNERLDQGEPEKMVVVDRAYIEINTPTVRDRLLEAGVRLGWLLNRALR